MNQPSTHDDIAFWAFLVLSNVWAAAGEGVFGLLYGLMAVAVRGPYWLHLAGRWLNKKRGL
jgi:hypothetical protein